MNTRNAKRCLLGGVAAAVVALAVAGNAAMALTGPDLPDSVWSYQSREKTKLQGSGAERSRSTGVIMFLADEWVAADRDHDGNVLVTRGTYVVDGSGSSGTRRLKSKDRFRALR